MAHISKATDYELFAELDKCKIAKVLLSKSAYKKQWSAYEIAIKQEVETRNSEFKNMTDDELLAELIG